MNMEVKAIDHLTQMSYNHNRLTYPDVSPERWGKVYGEQKVLLLEENFQITWRDCGIQST
jgi:hypothetical protein